MCYKALLGSPHLHKIPGHILLRPTIMVAQSGHQFYLSLSVSKNRERIRIVNVSICVSVYFINEKNVASKSSSSLCSMTCLFFQQDYKFTKEQPIYLLASNVALSINTAIFLSSQKKRKFEKMSGRIARHTEKLIWKTLFS